MNSADHVAFRTLSSRLQLPIRLLFGHCLRDFSCRSGCFSDIVFATSVADQVAFRTLSSRLQLPIRLLFGHCLRDFSLLRRRITVETTVSEVLTQVALHRRGPHLLNTVFFLALADGLFGLCGSERADELFTPPPPPVSPPPSPPPPAFSVRN